MKSCEEILMETLRAALTTVETNATFGDGEYEEVAQWIKGQLSAISGRRTFENFPKDSTCPICGTNRDLECWLVPIEGTDRGNIIEATPMHVECTGRAMIGRMRHDKGRGIVYSLLTKGT